MRDDVKTEQQQPPWPFTCYAHQRGGPNDMAGDFSYEEVSVLNAQCLALTPCTPICLVCAFPHENHPRIKAGCRLEHAATPEARRASAQVRWYQMEAAKSGKPLASLMADFNASRKAQEQQFQVALSAIVYYECMGTSCLI